MREKKKRYTRVDFRRSTLLINIKLPKHETAKMYSRVVSGSDYTMHTIFNGADDMRNILNDIDLSPRTAKNVTGVMEITGELGYERVYVTYAAVPHDDNAVYWRVQLIPDTIRKNDNHEWFF